MTNNNLAAQLKQIGLRAMPTQLDDFIARVTKARCSPLQILEEITKAETTERSRLSLERRLRISGVKRFKPMADFDWSWPTKIERDIIERALTLDFMGETRNLVLVGRNGLGKTMIAQNIAHAAVLAGHSVLFRSAAALLEELHRQSPEGRRRKLRGYANVGLLCIDEVGYLSFDDKAADLLYEVVNRRYERRPVILTTNRLCGAPHKRFNAESIFMRTPQSRGIARGHFAGFSLRITTEVFSRSISLSVALKRPVRSFGAITDSKASSFTLGSARV
jgi:DNA replication protein DnaC